jgi:intein/homing endonuclease
LLDIPRYDFGLCNGYSRSDIQELKVGDWVAIPKYSIEGNIEDIDFADDQNQKL